MGSRWTEEDEGARWADVGVPSMRTVEPNPHLEHHLDATQRNLERMHTHVAIADNKALIALTFQGAIVAGFAVLATTLKPHVESESVPVKFGVVVLVVLFLVTFLISTWKLFQAISPRVTPTESLDDPSALFFFGTIAGMTTDEFMNRMNRLDPEAIHIGLLKTTQSVARIATAKYKNLQTAYVCLGIQMFFFMLAALLVVI
jgi:hypothetical protein